MKRILLFFGLLALGLTVYAQVRPSHAAFPDGRRQAAPAFKMDSLRNGEHAHQGPPPPPKPRRFFHESDTLTLSDYIISIARINDQLNTIRDSAQLGYEIDHLQDDISEMTQEIKLFRQNTRGRHTAISIKNLYLYQSFVSNLKDENDQVRSRVNALYNRSYKAKLQLRRTLDDSIFRAIYVNRTAVINLDSKLGRVERKWKRTDSIVKGSLDTLDVLKATVADNSMKLSDMLNIIGKRLNRAKPQLFGPEISCLWHFQPTQPLARDSSKSMNLWKSEQKAIGFYFRQTSGKRSIVVFVGLLLYLWLFFKRKLLKKIKSTPETWHFLNLRYLNTSPVVSLLVAILSLMPFFDAYAPTSYMAMVFIVLLVAVTILFRRQSEPRFFSYWYGLVGLLIVDTVTYLVIEPATLPRLWMLAVHAAIIVTAIRFYKKISVQEPYSKWVRPAIVTGIVLTGLAVIANLFGRFSLAGILGLSGIFAITQALTLPIFIDTILEIVLVQLVSGRLKKGVDKPFDSSAVMSRIRLPLLLVSTLLWLISLTSNLNVYHDLYASLVNFFTAEQSIGNFSFKLISVVLFFLIIWLASLLQRLVSFLFGETGDELEDMTSISKAQHSRLLVIRLIVLICGFLLAIVVSGLPLDKITIVLGALGVGIGMGLQNVVNNFVSGIILIFDHSLQIGDEIEIGGLAGKVKEIGLRASTINTVDGAEIIIPNGSILSQNIVNWTYSNDQKRVTMSFTLSGKELDANLLNDLINTTVEKIPNVINKRKPAIIYTKVTPESLSLTVHFWSTIGNIDQVRSDAMMQLSHAFEAKGIGFNKPVVTCPMVGNKE